MAATYHLPPPTPEELSRASQMKNAGAELADIHAALKWPCTPTRIRKRLATFGGIIVTARKLAHLGDETTFTGSRQVGTP